VRRGIGIRSQVLDLGPDAGPGVREGRRLRPAARRADAREVVVRRADEAREAKPAGLDDGLDEGHIAGHALGRAFLEVVNNQRLHGHRRPVRAGQDWLPAVEPRRQLPGRQPRRPHDRHAHERGLGQRADGRPRPAAATSHQRNHEGGEHERAANASERWQP